MATQKIVLNRLESKLRLHLRRGGHALSDKSAISPEEKEIIAAWQPLQLESGEVKAHCSNRSGTRGCERSRFLTGDGRK